MARLQDLYKDKIVGQLKEQFNYDSVMQVPKITKITLNMGVGEALVDKKVMDHATADMALPGCYKTHSETAEGTPGINRRN